MAGLMAALERHGVNTVEPVDAVTDSPGPANTADPALPAAGDPPVAGAPKPKESDHSRWPEGAAEVGNRAQV